jgi:hypothetical protein
MSAGDALLMVLRHAHNLAGTARRGAGPQASHPTTG